MRIYISGPISGREPEEARAKFDHVAKLIRRVGHVPVNPMDMPQGLSWKTYMQMDFDLLGSGDIDGVYMLRGWEESNGACLERYFAALNGIPVAYESVEDIKKYRKTEERK